MEIKHILSLIILTLFCYSCKTTVMKNNIDSENIDYLTDSLSKSSMSNVFSKSDDSNNIDEVIELSKKKIIKHFRKNKYNLDKKNIIYIVNYISFDSESICSKKFNEKTNSYKQFFKGWNIQHFVTGYLCNENGIYLAASTGYTLINNPKNYNNYMLTSALVQLGFSKEYKAFVNIQCKKNNYYIGYNDLTLDIYEVVDEKLILLNNNLIK